MTTSIQRVMSYAISVGLQIDAKDANRNLNQFRREVGFAKAATQDITASIKIFREVTKDLNLTNEQAAIVEARLTAAHEKRRAKVLELLPAIDANRVAGLKTQEGIQAERYAVEAARAALEKRLITYKKDKVAKEAAAKAALELAAAEKAAAQDAAVIARRAPRQAFNAALDEVLGANNAARQRQNELLASGRQYMQQFDTATQRATRQLREANTQFRSGAISQEQYALATTAIRQQNNLLHQSFSSLKTAVTTLVGPLVLVYSAYRGFTESIKLSAELEQATAKFKVFTGSLREAEQTLAEIRELSRSSPVSFTGGQRAVTTMLQFGVASKDVTKSLRQVAEITGGDTQRMEALALAFGQANAAGRLMGQELLQMVNAGFNPLKVISDQTGKSMKDLKDAMADGEVSFEMVSQAFADAVGPGGQFNGLLKEMANTTAGQLTRAANAVQELGIAFGDLLALGGTRGVLGQFTESISVMVNTLNNVKSLYEYFQGATAGGPSTRDLLEIMGPGYREGKLGNVQQVTDLSAFTDGSKDLFEFLENYDRVAAVLGKDLASEVGRDVVNNAKEVKAALEDLNAVRAKAAADRTEAEQAALASTDRRDRNAKNVNQAERDRLVNEFNDAIAQPGADFEGLFVAHVDETGQGYLTDDRVEEYKRYRAEIEKANEALREQVRIKAAFSDSIAGAEGDLLKNRFGDRAGNVELIRDQATGKEREGINDAIEAGKNYDEIVKLANAEAQAQLKTLEAIQAKNKAYEDAKEKQKETDKLAKEAAAEAKRAAKEKAREDEQRAKKEADEFKKLKKQADEIRNAGNPFGDFIDKLSDAQLLLDQGLLSGGGYFAERNRLATENVKNVSATAAPVATKGSQEAFQLITGQTVDKITRQLQEAEKQTLLATTAEAVRRSTLDKLKELVDDQPVVVGP